MSIINRISLIVLAVCLVVPAAEAAKSRVKGDPTMSWESPLGKGDIPNDAYHRCLVLKALFPAADQASETNRQNHEILSDYIANLYAQSVIILAQLEKESKTEEKSVGVSMDNETDLTEEEVLYRLGDISRRLNIIVSLEAANTAVYALDNLVSNLARNTYEIFRALKNGKYEFVDDCELLK